MNHLKSYLDYITEANIMYFVDEIDNAVTQLESIANSGIEMYDAERLLSRLSDGAIKDILIKNINGNTDNNLIEIKNIVRHLSGSEPHSFFDYIDKLYDLSQSVTK